MGFGGDHCVWFEKHIGRTFLYQYRAMFVYLEMMVP
jgi:hypothetical protein